MTLIKTTVAYSISNGGDGSAYSRWFLTEEDADSDQEVSVEEGMDGWGESCTGTVETFEGSDIHKEAVKNSAKLVERIKALEDGKNLKHER